MTNKHAAKELFAVFVLGVAWFLGMYATRSVDAQSPQPTIIPIGSNWQFGPGSGTTQSGGVSVLYAGSQTATLDGTFSQDLGISPRTVQAPSPGWQYGTEGTFVLTFTTMNYFPSYPGKYNAEITFGTQSLCENYGWGTSHWSRVMLVCPSSNYMVFGKSLPGGGPPQGANNLVLHFTVNGWPVIFDNVSLTFTEIP
jgi:hypothetical protein